MKCKKCKREIADNSIYCNWCGQKQIAEKKEAKLPKAKQLSSGTWRIQYMLDGKRISVTAPTEKECIAKAREMKQKQITSGENPSSMTLREACQNYITSRENILSPSTIKAYKSITENRLGSLMNRKVSDIDNNMYQAAINEEARNLSQKTIKNVAYFIVTVCDNVCGKKLSCALPSYKAPSHAFLEPEYILPFIEKVRNTPSEAAILLGLHSLRLSEIYALGKKDVDMKKKIIHVNKAEVRGPDGFVLRNTTKTASSTRDIPIMIPRLLELSDQIPISVDRNRLCKDINKVCEELGIEPIGCHGLRHSFASLAAHLKMPEQECMRLGGWSTPQIMREIYTHIASSDRAAAQQAMKDFFGQ